MGLVINLLNPKIAVLHLSLLPQFVDPERGAVLAQSLALGLTQIAGSLAANGCIVLGAPSSWLARRPIWLGLQRWFMATVLGTLAVRLSTSVPGRRPRPKIRGHPDTPRRLRRAPRDRKHATRHA